MGKPRLSVIVITMNRPDDLRAFLPSLVNQTCLVDELVVVDAGHLDIIEGLIREELAGSGIALKYATSRPGTSLQRNIALEIAEGDFFFFFDDDVILESNYVAASMACFNTEHQPPVGVVLGTFNSPPRKTGWRTRYFRLFGMTHATATAPAAVLRSGAVRWLIDPPGVENVPVASGGRVVYRSQCLIHHRFDEFLPGYTMSEDVELSFRVAKDWAIVQTPHARLFHARSSINRNQYGDRVSRLIYSRFYFFKKHVNKTPINLLAFAWSNMGIVALYSLVALFKSTNGPVPVLKGIMGGYARCWADLTSRP